MDKAKFFHNHSSNKNTPQKHKIKGEVSSKESSASKGKVLADTDKEDCPNVEKILQQTDYQAFIEKSRRLKQTNYPSIFDELKISSDSSFDQTTVFDIEDINFPTLECTKTQLIEVSSQIIMNNNFSQSNLNEKMVKQLIKTIALGYNQIAYHNFSHAFSLMQLFYNCLKIDASFQSLFSKEQITFALIAGLAHDINHNGTNNGFQAKTKSKLAEEAKNQSILEKMHVLKFFTLLKENPHINILKKTENSANMKQMIMRLIIATDIAKHFTNLNKFIEKRNKKQFNFKNLQDRYFVLEQVFHACDIGNPCLDFDQYISWSSLLSYQFNEQTKLEKENGVEITDFLVYRGKKQFYKGQLGFINGIVLPQWKELACAWNGFKGLTKAIEANIEEIEKRREQEKQE